jgi:galactokinase
MSDTNNWQQAANIALLKQNTLKTEGATLHIQNAMISDSKAKAAIADKEIAEKRHQSAHVQTHVELILAKQELDETKAALAAANELVADWQSAMFAWKDLAQALRDEIKECPNAEAHKFGKDQKARNARLWTQEDKERVSKKLAPKYTPAEKTAGVLVN